MATDATHNLTEKLMEQDLLNGHSPITHSDESCSAVRGKTAGTVSSFVLLYAYYTFAFGMVT